MALAGCWIITASTRLRKLGNVAPVEDRWHQSATPGLGGVPIYIAFCLVACLAGELPPLSMAILLSALPLLVIGLYDDLKPVRPGLKLKAQMLSACAFLLFVFSPSGGQHFFGDGNLAVQVLSLLVCLTWIVAVINSINLLDNMDGLAGGIALIACLTLAVLIYRSNQYLEMSVLLIILAASIAGFLVLNYQPAKLFMGDAGALWIGLVVGIGALIVVRAESVNHVEQSPFLLPVNWLLALMVCAVPISDTLMVMITRKLRGQPVSVGGRDHLSHRLVAIGFSERVSVGILWAVALVSSILAVLIQALPASVWITPVGIFLVLLLASIICLVRLSASSMSAGQRRMLPMAVPEQGAGSL